MRTLRILISLLLLTAFAQAGNDRIQSDLLDFATEMAQEGNWREASFRWRMALNNDPANAHIRNNLAVAAEILGDYEKAKGLYRQSLQENPDSGALHDNAARFERLMKKVSEHDTDNSGPATELPFDPKRMRKARTSRIVERVSARFKLPPRVDISAHRNLLVASFLVEEEEDIDLNREITRYLRNRLSRTSRLDVLPVTPAPPIPEMPLDELAANAAFWKRLGRIHEADIIVSGSVDFQRRDASGFRDVDVISNLTGQKVRESRFLEQEEFRYTLEVLFLEGATGNLIHRDRLERAAVYTGGGNDPLTAFFDLVDSLARDVVAVVSPRIMEDTRFIYRR
jgi:hypothetical protein